MSEAWKIETISHTQKLVLLALCDHAKDDGVCFPSIQHMVKKCCLSDRSVQKSMSDLEFMGIIFKRSRPGKSTMYTISISTYTPEPRSPRTTFTPNHVHPTPERGSPPPPNVVHPTPERGSPIIIIEPSIETSINIIPKKRIPKNIVTYTDEFEFAWNLYPKREGDNPKQKAFKAWSARLKENNSAQDMIDGVSKYLNYCKIKGMINTPYIKQASTFFGPEKPFLENWDINPNQSKGNQNDYQQRSIDTGTTIAGSCARAYFTSQNRTISGKS